jgi:large subunit ribosomal protein L14
MKGVAARITWGLNIGAIITAADNGGARIVKVVGVVGGKGTRGRQQPAKVGDWVKVSVKKGNLDMKGKVFDAIIIRQKKPYRRNTGERIAFEDNAAALLKDEKGNPKGTQIKGPCAREVSVKWPSVAKIAQSIV